MIVVPFWPRRASNVPSLICRVHSHTAVMSWKLLLSLWQRTLCSVRDSSLSSATMSPETICAAFLLPSQYCGEKTKVNFNLSTSRVDQHVTIGMATERSAATRPRTHAPPSSGAAI